MSKSRFLQFVKQLNVDDNLFEAIQDGYEAIYEQGNSWGGYINGTQVTPYLNHQGAPMGDWKNIMKQEGSPIGAVGGSGESGTNIYRYGPSLPGPTRNIGEETREQWDAPPKFPTIQHDQSNMVKKLIKKSQSHMPAANATNVAPQVTDANASSNIGGGGAYALNMGISV
jgi:hypothetical protein